jgi:exopolyphosphatase / guanosine-5'-triphosphate,3'-diphosphate pyrophosphatase
MLCGCIDIGTNTTRVLVAETHPQGLKEVLQRRVFTRLGRGLAPGGTIPAARIAETAAIVAELHAVAEQAGAGTIRAVATAVIRRAANRSEFIEAMRTHGGVELSVLDGEEEARLAFLGATRTAGRPLPGRVAVVDVGGGSTEIAVGTTAGGVQWAASFPFGSGFLADAYLGSDPAEEDELQAVRAHAARALTGVSAGPIDHALAVGGSAASLRRMVGDELNARTLAQALGVLSSGPATDVAARFGLDPQRVRLMPAGLLALDAAAQALGHPLQIGCGGLREGVLLDLAGL